MGLILKKGKAGVLRSTWWGRYCVKGKYFDVDLRVPVRGVVPVDIAGHVSLKCKGDETFERSRKAAQKEFDQLVATKQEHPEEMRAKVYKARTGVDVEGVPLNHLAGLWKTQKRAYKPTAGWETTITTWFNDFIAFAEKYAREHNTHCNTINDVTPEIAGAWFEDLKQTFAWETVTKKMSLMRGAFRRYATSGRVNPFEGIVVRNRDAESARVNHKPLTAEQTERLFECSRGDAYIYPLIVTAACTGMRIGDVCALKWESIDLQAGFIDVVTAKAGVRATVPIFARLRDVLMERDALAINDKTSPYVFPHAADKYARNPAWIYRAAKPYFARAVFEDEKQPEEDANKPVPALVDVIDAAGFTPGKRERLLKVYAMRKAGVTNKDIAIELGVARSQISMDLHAIEKLTGEELRPRAAAICEYATRLALIEKTRGATTAGRNRKASLYGWHSLRATFVVLAHEAGVPLADIAKVVGHTTTEMTMQYFNPEKRHAAERLKAQMRGSVLNGGGTFDARNVIEAPTTPADGAPLMLSGDAARVLAIVRVAMMPEDSARVTATLNAAGIDMDADPVRALAMMNVLLPPNEVKRLSAVCMAAGVVNKI